MTARFPYYQLRAVDAQESPAGTWLTDASGQIAGKCTFKYKTLPHITLKSVARNAALDPIFEKHEPILASRFKELNTALSHVTADARQKLAGKLTEKIKNEGRKAITDADRRRWELPASEWRDWEVPFDRDPDWPRPLRDALTAYRVALGAPRWTR